MPASPVAQRCGAGFTSASTFLDAPSIQEGAPILLATASRIREGDVQPLGNLPPQAKGGRQALFRWERGWGEGVSPDVDKPVRFATNGNVHPLCP